MDAHGTVLSTLPKALLAYLAALGHEATALAREASLHDMAWDDEDARVPRERVDALWEIAARVTGDGAIGARFAQALPAGNAGVLEMVTLSAASVRVALGHVCRYWRLLNDGVDLHLDVRDGRATLVHCTRSEKPLARAWIDLTAVALSVLSMRSLVRPRAALEIALPYAEDAWSAELQAIVATPLVHDAPHLAITYPEDALEERLISANPSLNAVALAHADKLLSRRQEAGDPELLRLVRSALVERLETGDATLDRVARALGVSPRTLQRRLGEEKTSLRALLDDARKDIALREVTAGSRSVTDLAFLLGFSETSAFDRAFRRWTGMSPAHWRAR